MSPLSHGELVQMETAAKNRAAQRHTCKTCRYSIVSIPGKEFRCIKRSKTYELNEITRRLCTCWKGPRKAGERDER